MRDGFARLLAGRGLLVVALLERAYTTRYARHFYTRAELELFSTKWSSGG